MKRLSKTVLISLIFTTQILSAYPTDMPAFPVQRLFELPDPRNLSYNEVMDLLAFIESDSFEERCSPEDLKRANQLIAFLATEGAAEDQKDRVEMSIASLFKTDYCQYAYRIDSNTQHSVQPAIFRQDQQNIIPCKSWFKKQWDETRRFVKKHKKEIIIGAIVVVAVTVVVVGAVAISSSAAGAAAGSIAASAGASDSGSSHPQEKNPGRDPGPPDEGLLTASLQEQIATFKESVAQEQLAAVSEFSGISMEENGRIIGSLFTHKTVDALTAQAAEDPFLSYELQNLGFNADYPLPKWINDSPHASTDLAFSTSYLPAYIDSSADLNTLAYQVRGNLALSSECYVQAVQDFGKAIELEPTDPNSYLGRGVANFELGHYEESVADYNNYTSQTKQSSSVTDFSIGFAKGLPKGIYDSGEGILLFVTDLACHPIQTGGKVYDSLATLSSFAKSGEWDLIAETLSPELHQLVSEWDTLSAREKGELSGYAFGKHGADILLPGATVKAVAKGSMAAKELAAVCKNLQAAEKLLVLEAVAEGGTVGMNVGEVVSSARRALEIGEDFGLGAKEIAALKQSGELEQIIGKGRDFFAGNPELQASYDLFRTAKTTLKPYAKQAMPESEIRNLIHQHGIPTFQRPSGIPDNYLVRITEKGAGMEYFDPIQPKTSIRVMPGTPHSPNPCQQVPYIIQTKRGKTFDKFAKEVSANVPEAHIPLCEFVYKD